MYVQRPDRQPCVRHHKLMPSTAIRIALKQLGFNDTYHMDSLFENPPDMDLWREAFLAKFKNQGRPFGKEQWDQLLGHCQAVCDLPTTAFIPELIAAYPDAKLILTPREENSWYASCQRTVQTAAMARSMHVCLMHLFSQKTIRILSILPSIPPNAQHIQD